MHVSINVPAATQVTAHWDNIQAHGNLVMMDHGELAEMCCEAHKDFTGVKGRWMLTADHGLLTTWWFQHYGWDEAAQIWQPKQPFLDW